MSFFLFLYVTRQKFVRHEQSASRRRVVSWRHGCHGLSWLVMACVIRSAVYLNATVCRNGRGSFCSANSPATSGWQCVIDQSRANHASSKGPTSVISALYFGYRRSKNKKLLSHDEDMTLEVCKQDVLISKAAVNIWIVLFFLSGLVAMGLFLEGDIGNEIQLSLDIMDNASIADVCTTGTLTPFST